MDQNKVIDAANARAALYDSDDRQDIKVDVMNAFFAGAKFGALSEREEIAKDARECGGMMGSASCRAEERKRDVQSG